MDRFIITEEQLNLLNQEADSYFNGYLAPIGDISNPLFEYMTTHSDIPLTEGLIKTYPVDTTIRYIKNLFGLPNNKIFLLGSKNAPKIGVRVEKTPENEEMLDRAFGLCGYIKTLEFKSSDVDFTYTYIPKYSGDLTDRVRQCDRLIHVSPIYNKEKILSNGLKPSDKGNQYTYDSRVYFFPDTIDLREVNFQMCSFDSTLKNKRNNHIWVIFMIDTAKIPEDVKFYYDPMYASGTYTKDNIPPSAIVGAYDVDLVKVNRPLNEIVHIGKEINENNAFYITEEQYNFLINGK